ncbi:hypothetical protein OSCI_3180008 [Kamptonema sp. PCC 6506]|nr:hypothetical protein OSCI_3180008 [Kamptonema sp. PCC 6506]
MSTLALPDRIIQIEEVKSYSFKLKSILEASLYLMILFDGQESFHSNRTSHSLKY